MLVPRIRIVIFALLAVAMPGFFLAVARIDRAQDASSRGEANKPVDWPASGEAPPHMNIQLENRRFQTLPKEIVDVYLDPSGRPWFKIAPETLRMVPWPYLRPDAFKRMIEREYPLSNPQFAAGDLLLFESPSKHTAMRVWFHLSSFEGGTGNPGHTWSALLGYSGTPGAWIERYDPSTYSIGGSFPGHHEFTGVSGGENTCVDGHAFFASSNSVECFDGNSWSRQVTWKKEYFPQTYFLPPDNVFPCIVPELDGKGVIVPLPHETAAAWRWRGGQWTKLPLVELADAAAAEHPQLSKNPDAQMAFKLWYLALGGIEGPWFKLFKNELNIYGYYNWASDHYIGPYIVRETRAVTVDDVGRVYIAANQIWDSRTKNADAKTRSRVDQLRQLEEEHAKSVRYAPDDVRSKLDQQIVDMAGGILVIERNGNIHCLMGSRYFNGASADYIGAADGYHSRPLLIRNGGAGWLAGEYKKVAPSLLDFKTWAIVETPSALEFSNLIAAEDNGTVFMRNPQADFSSPFHGSQILVYQLNSPESQ